MKRFFSIFIVLVSAPTTAQAMSEIDRCVSAATLTAEDSITLGELRQNCQREQALSVAEIEAVQTSTEALEEIAPITVAEAEVAVSPTESAIDQRIFFERKEGWNSFVLLPHKPNYLLMSHNTQHPNEDPFRLAEPDKEIDLQHLEAKFQLSLKLPVARGLINHHGDLYFGYTNRSFWQILNKDDSSPFRETNHEPEAWLSFKTDFNILGLHNSVIRTGFSHQSNGRSGSLSRSWNRVYADFILERGNAYFSFKPWWRVPESRKDDDNRDITDYMGNFELRGLYKHKNHNFDAMLRHGFGESKTSIQIGWSFPINKRVRGYAQWFNGYGESLIDYDSRSNSIWVGVLLSDWV